MATLAPLPLNEDRRLAMLRKTAIFDSEPEPVFDTLVEHLRNHYDVPIALVSLLDADRQWFKAARGLDLDESPREISFCGHAIFCDQPFVVPDTHEDPRFSDNPLVRGEPRARFYAGAPIFLSPGIAAGTVCIIDTCARQDLQAFCALTNAASFVARELHKRTGNKGPYSSTTECPVFATEDHVRCVVSAELRGVAHPDLAQAVLGRCRPATKRVEIDCAACTFIDSAAVGTLLQIFNICARNGTEFALTNLSSATAQQLSRLKLEQLFEVSLQHS